MDRNALITGASGLLGRQVVHAFASAGWNTVGTGLTRANPPTILKVDLTNSAEVFEVLDQVNPEVVVHCEHVPAVFLYTAKQADLRLIEGAANRFPDKCDADPDSARSTNITASEYLAAACAERHILLLYISTDYVFPGKPGEAPYEVDSKTAPTNLYGQTKLDGEKVVLQATQAERLGVVLRVPVLYGKAHEPRESAVNILMDILWKSQEKDAKIQMDDWAQRYPTNTEDVARVCLEVSTKYLHDPKDRQNLPPILQFSSEDRMTKYEICQTFAEIMGLPLGGIIPDRQGPDPDAAIQRPMDTHLSNRVLQENGISVNTQSFNAWWRWEVKAFRK